MWIVDLIWLVWDQLGALLRKNLHLKMREKRQTLLEIISPALILTLFFIINSSNMIDFTSKGVPHYPIEPLPPLHQVVCTASTRLFCRLAFMPTSSQLANSVMHILQNELGREQIIAIVGFESEEQFIQQNNNQFFAAIVFPSPPDNKNQFLLRWSESGMASSLEHQSPGMNRKASLQSQQDLLTNQTSYYVSTGFATLQQMLSSALALATSFDNDSNTNSSFFNGLQISTAAFPLKPSSIGVNPVTLTWPMYFMMIFFSIMSHHVVLLVVEKERMLKPALRMAGCTYSAYNLSWWITTGISLSFAVLLLIVTTRILGFIAHSDVIILFIVLECYGISMIQVGSVISIFISKPRSAALIISLVQFVVAGLWYTVHLEMNLPSASSTGILINAALAALFSPVSFGELIFQTAQLEFDGIGLGWNQLLLRNGSGLFPLLFVGFLVLDCVIYALICLYLEQTHQDGRGRSWLFLFKSTFWREIQEELAIVAQGGSTESEDLPGSHVAANMVKVHHLRKVFPRSNRISSRNLFNLNIFGGRRVASGSSDVIAIEDLDLEMHGGQIFALLGHNGAGKSTTIGVLTGQIQQTSGTATIMGWDISDGMGIIRRQMGVCQQTNVLWDNLTPLEHLRLWASIRSVPKHKRQNDTESRLCDVGLWEQRNDLVSTFSGGMKRKLCVAMSLVGDPRLLFLDEPTSGMDPLSRRAMWKLLQQYKSHKVVCLSTHSMEEADQLGDRIGIMSKGKLDVVGTSIFLKNHYGIGYTLHITRAAGSDCDERELLTWIRRFVPDAQFGSSSSLQTGSTVADTDGPVQEVEEATRHRNQPPKNELEFTLPINSVGAFADLFEALESNLEQLHISSFGLCMATLEEVFLRIARQIEEEEETANQPPM